VSSKIEWNDVIRKEARGINDEDLGEVQEVSNGFIVVQKGIINKEKFFIPKDKAESFNGKILRFKISKDEISNNYQRDTYPEPTYQDESDKTSTIRKPEKITIDVIEEKLDISKRAEGSHVSHVKESVKEIRTVQVPVVYEEISK
jgi:hypothetical protein